MRLIRRKSDGWVIFAIYGGGALGAYLLTDIPWLPVGVGSIISIVGLLIGIFFVGVLLFVPTRVFWDWLVMGRNNVE